MPSPVLARTVKEAQRRALLRITGLLGAKHDPAPSQSDAIAGALLASVCLWSGRPGSPLTI